MSKSEERAFEAYPVCMQELIHIDHTTEFVDANKRDRGVYAEGYKQALADVKEMVERQQLANHSGTDEWIKAKQVAYESILDFIDEQSK